MIFSVFLLFPLVSPNLLSASDDFFSYSIYLRSGAGANFRGGDQECFNNPGAGANEFRLGNECSNYGEMAFAGHPLRPNENSPVHFKAQMRLAFNQDARTNWEGANGDNPIAVRESFVEGGGINGTPYTFWAGKRFYREHDLYMNDHYYFADMSGNGGGIGHIPLAGGNLHLAWLREGRDLETDKGARSMQVIDARLMGMDLGERYNLNIWTAYAFLPKAEITDTDSASVGEKLASQQGYLVGGLLERSLSRGFNHFALMYGKGLLREFNLFAPQDTLENSPAADELKKSNRIRAINHLTYDLHNDLSFHLAATYELRDGGSSDNKEKWYSLGVRPVYYITDNYHLVFEAGHSIVDPKGQDKRKLTRISFAPQVSTGRSIWGRPVVRAFITQSFWSDSNKGSVGGAAYREKTSGGSYGVQIEAWF